MRLVMVALSGGGLILTLASCEARWGNDRLRDSVSCEGEAVQSCRPVCDYWWDRWYGYYPVCWDQCFTTCYPAPEPPPPVSPAPPPAQSA